MASRSTSLAVSEQTTDASEDLDEIVEGLQQDEKMISPKYFYDERGSRLFDKITRLPEYYPTETELKIMRDHIDEIADLVGEQASLIEFGAGSSVKIRILLDHLKSLAVYVPVDISEDHLVAAAENLKADYPDLEVLPVVADFMQPFDLPQPAVMPVKNVVYFPGSTIGNFPRSAAIEFLRHVAEVVGAGGGLLIGIDLEKARSVLERAYNDSDGVTAKFNLNLLARINRELGGDFDLDAFDHRAVYNAQEGRIEMYLVSRIEQTVHVAGESFFFRTGETICTEHSNKYSLESFAEMSRHGGFEVERVWVDDDDLFSVQYLRAV